MAKVIALPGAASRPIRQPKKRSPGKWGDRDREYPPNTMPDGRKRVRLKVGTKPDGKPEYKNFTGATLAEAKANKAEYTRQCEEEKRAPLRVRSEVDPSQTLAQWAKRWDRANHRGGERYQLSNTSIVSKICASALGKMPLSDIKKIDVQDFANDCTYAKKKRPYSSSYVSSIHHVLFTLFEDAVDDEIILRNPCKRIVWQDNGEEHVRELEDWERDFVTAHWRVHPAGVGAMLMLYAGLRPDEARALNWDNVLPDEIVVRDSCYFNRSGRMVLKLGVTKTLAGQRAVPLAPQLREVLDSLERRPGELVWRASEAGSTSEIAYSRGWESFIVALKAAKLGVPPNKHGDYSGIRVDRLDDERRAAWEALFDFTPRSLRPTYCTMIYEGGVDEKLMQELMGHADLETTLKVYARLRKAHKQRKYTAVNDYFSELQSQQKQPGEDPDSGAKP